MKLLEDYDALKEKINQVLNNFDFEEVHAYMVLTKWTWAGSDSAPTIDALRDTAKEQLYYVVGVYQQKQRSTVCGTGGFYAYIFDWDGEYHLKLTFEPFRYSTY